MKRRYGVSAHRGHKQPLESAILDWLIGITVAYVHAGHTNHGAGGPDRTRCANPSGSRPR